MRINTKKVTSLAEAIGTLVINGFEVEYDSNEYGDTVYIKTKEGLVSIGDFNHENITVSELVNLANAAS